MRGVRIIHGDSRQELRALADNSIDAVATDPPYALVSIGKRFGADNAAPVKVKEFDGKGSSPYLRAASGFMGQKWDTGETAFDPDFWREVLRVLKPGGHAVVFGGTRTYHRMACAIEDAGFEIRDMVSWIYGAGFPKSHNISRTLNDERCVCAEPQTECELRPVRDGHVPPPDNACDERGQVLLSRVSEQSTPHLRSEPKERQLRVQESVVEGRSDVQARPRQLSGRQVRASASLGDADGPHERLHHGASPSNGADVRLSSDANGVREPQGPQPSEQRDGQSGTVADERGPQTRGGWSLCGRCGKPLVPEGLGTALKPALEPIVLARKPLSESTIAANVLKWGTGALNIDACRISAERGTGWGGAAAGGATWNEDNSGLCKEGDARPVNGRWPANVTHDGSDEVVAAFPDSDASAGPFYHKATLNAQSMINIAGRSEELAGVGFGDTGSAARFFYSAKADSDDRMGSRHPTVKPVALMRWLIRLITPPGGVVLDPFAGSGSTGVAAIAEGFDAILIEREAAYVADIRLRLDHAQGDGAHSGSLKTRNKIEPKVALPLFGAA